MSAEKVEKALKRDSLSDYLPYLAYDKKEQEFINTDRTFGYLYECSPVYFLGEEQVNVLTSILKQDYGKGAVLQFILFADTNIDHYCDLIQQGDKRQTPLTKKMSDDYVGFLKNYPKYQSKTKSNQLKNFRLFVALKTKTSLSKTIVCALTESLAGVGLQPTQMNAGALLSLIRQLLNGSKHNQRHYDDGKPIAPQTIFADTEINFSGNDLIKINDEFVSVITPKAFPDKVNEQSLNTTQVNELIGSYQGGINDLDQITSRFIWSCNVLLDSVGGELQRKTYLANLQRAASKLSNNITDRISALSLAYKNNNNDCYLKFIPSLVIFANNKEQLSAATTKALRLWESKGFSMQQESHIKHLMFLSSLPFGLYLGKNNKNINLLDRHFIASSKAIATQLPLQGDYFGFGHPVVPLTGRKSQVQGLDLFCKKSNNHNFLCCATSGGGKSFFVNWLLIHYFTAGAKIRINDIGGSYKKITKLVGGTYIDIEDNRVNLNPFQVSNNLKRDYEQEDNSHYDEVDKTHDIETIVMILGEMIYANIEDGKLSSEEVGLLTHAVKETIARGIVKNAIDFVQDYLSDLYQFSDEKSIPGSLNRRAKELSFNLCEFSSKGEYGHLFNGVSENAWQDNPFVVLELESLSAKPALMKVVSLQIINMMTQEMYQGDRSEMKISIFDEVAFMFGSSQRLAKVVEDGYRRARKYNGCFGTIFQSILDTKLFGRVGEVMNNNAAFKFYLESGDYEKAIKEGLITLDDFASKLLTSIQSNRPNYSEIFMDTPGGIGVSRLMVSPFSHAVATTDAHEVVEIESYQQQGLSIVDALEKFATKRSVKA